MRTMSSSTVIACLNNLGKVAVDIILNSSDFKEQHLKTYYRVKDSAVALMNAFIIKED